MSDDYEAKKAEVLKLRKAFVHGAGWADLCPRAAYEYEAVVRYPLPEREPLVVETFPYGDTSKHSDRQRRINNGISEVRFSGRPWSESDLTLAHMRALVADADAQEREKGA